MPEREQAAPLTLPTMRTCACNPLNAHLCLEPTYRDLCDQLDAERARADRLAKELERAAEQLAAASVLVGIHRSRE